MKSKKQLFKANFLSCHMFPLPFINCDVPQFLSYLVGFEFRFGSLQMHGNWHGHFFMVLIKKHYKYL